MADQEDSGGKLFSHCVFTLYASGDLTDNLASEISRLLVEYGGTVVPPKRDGSLPQLHNITHIVSNTIDFPEFTEAAAMLVPVVNKSWVTASVTKNKLAQLRPYCPDPRMFFSQVVVSCADIPSLDRETIVGATVAMGGMESENLSKLVTHVCALSMEHDKCKVVEEKGLKAKIVLPHWFDDCFKLGKRIDEGPYLLPDPEILRVHPEEDVAVPSTNHLEGATSALPEYIPPPDGDSLSARPKPTVFAGKKVMLSWDLAITTRLRKIIKRLIKHGGGEVIDLVEDCDMFICQFREGNQYVAASQLGYDVGSLSWLYYLIVQNKWTSPHQKLLHYPVPKDGLPGFKGLKITVSNYGGEARIYLENLITAAGATFTKTMKSDNSHLITARNNSQKCEAAQEWNINMINHLWLEESYAKCELQSVTVDRYRHFPPRTNLGEVIGQTFLDQAKVREIYYPGEPAHPTTASKRKRKIQQMAEENAYQKGPAAGVVIGRHAKREFDVMQDEDAEMPGNDDDDDEPRTAGPPKKKRASEEFTTPARGRYARVGKENETPSTVSISTSGRSAKDKARNALSGLAEDIALYEKEKKRSTKDGHRPWGGKRAADLVEKENLGKKQTSSPAGARVLDEEDAINKRSAKKSKFSLPQVEMRVILTGFQPWVKDKSREDTDRRKLRSLGVSVVSDGQPCDYLVAPQIVRTVKFLRNLSKGATVVSSEWIEECLNSGEVAPPEDFLLQDEENEEKLGFKLQKSVERAGQLKGKLLWKTIVYCSASIKSGTESYRAIIEANGAIFLVYGPRSGITLKPTKPEEDEGGPEPVYLLSSSSPEEKKLWPRFEAMARAGNMEPRIVAADWLLDVVMKQEVSFDEQYLVTNFFRSSS